MSCTNESSRVLAKSAISRKLCKGAWEGDYGNGKKKSVAFWWWKKKQRRSVLGVLLVLVRLAGPPQNRAHTIFGCQVESKVSEKRRQFFFSKVAEPTARTFDNMDACQLVRA